MQIDMIERLPVPAEVERDLSQGNFYQIQTLYWWRIEIHVHVSVICMPCAFLSIRQS